MAITISAEGVSDEQKQTDKFKTACQEMTDQLSQAGFAEILCAHEAAHVFFFTMAGMQNYDTSPARLWYNPAIDDYEGRLASITPGPIPQADSPQKFNEDFQYIAAAHAAGGVAARKIRPIWDVGDQDDRNRFQELCEN